MKTMTVLKGIIASVVILGAVSVNAQVSNVALGKKCRATSTKEGGVPSRAVDGNTDGVWTNNTITHTNDQDNPWWEVDLGANYDVSKIQIWNRTDDCCWNRLQGFYVMTSEKPITQNMTEAKYQFTNAGPLSFTTSTQPSMSLEAKKKCRYVRVFIPGKLKILSLAEVQVFGTPAK